MKHGDRTRFQTSPHGQDIIIIEAFRKFVSELEAVNNWAASVDQICRELEVELQMEREARQEAETRVRIFE